MNFSTSAKATISSNLRSTSFLLMPRMAPFKKVFSRPVSSGWKPVPTSSRLPMRPTHLGVTRGGLGDAGKDFEQRSFAGAVAADDAYHLALAHVERHIFQRPNVRRIVVAVAVAVSAAEQASGRTHRAGQCVAQGEIVLPLADAVDACSGFQRE